MHSIVKVRYKYPYLVIQIFLGEATDKLRQDFTRDFYFEGW